MTSDLNGCRRSSLPSTSTIPAAEHERDSTSDYDRQRTVDEALEKEEKEITARSDPETAKSRMADK